MRTHIHSSASNCCPSDRKYVKIRAICGRINLKRYFLKNIIPIDKSSPTDDNFSPTDSRFTQIYDLSGKWSNRISKVALTKTIKTPNSIFREPSAYIFRCNSLSESKLSFIDLQQTMSQSMLCFLKIQLGDMHEKVTGL